MGAPKRGSASALSWREVECRSQLHAAAAETEAAATRSVPTFAEPPAGAAGSKPSRHLQPTSARVAQCKRQGLCPVVPVASTTRMARSWDRPASPAQKMHSAQQTSAASVIPSEMQRHAWQTPAEAKPQAPVRSVGKAMVLGKAARRKRGCAGEWSAPGSLGRFVPEPVKPYGCEQRTCYA
mmetsp:Transcript_28312/g.73732  ORF Transcript_28312/g.73732 Transcript_28312/m.73732 type:complete len:181 (+) Transcript_28312:368-910(+)